MRGLMIGDAELGAIQAVRERAAAAPVDMPGLAMRLATVEGKEAHRQQMSAQTLELPFGFLVTFSVETGHPCGTARHLSVSLQDANTTGRVPHPAAVWEVAIQFGFTGSLEMCAIWPEVLQGHGRAINVVQPIEAPSTARLQ